jgi:hypothetical protein
MVASHSSTAVAVVQQAAKLVLCCLLNIELNVQVSDATKFNSSIQLSTYYFSQCLFLPKPKVASVNIILVNSIVQTSPGTAAANGYF